MSVDRPVMKTPRSLGIEITSQCNLRCLYCAHFASPGEVADLPAAEWLRFFEELNRCAVMDVTLSGGEPLVREDLPELLDGLVRNRMRYSILSNGTLITDEFASLLKSTGRCNYVQVSIDGSTASTHDACRGKGTFDRAIESITILQDRRIPVTVRVTINRANVGDLERVAKLLLEELKLPSFSTNSASSVGLCQSNSHIQLSPEDRTEAMRMLIRLEAQYPGRIQASAGPLAEARMWSDMEQARRECREPMHNRGALTGCNCTFDKIAVRSDGVIVPCSQLSHVEIGRINRDSLADVWQQHPVMKQLRERHLISLDRFEFCRGCAYLDYCTGNCPGLAYTTLGEIDHPSPDACLRRFLAEGGKLPEMSR